MAKIDVEAYWGNKPPEPSANCEKWVARIKDGWRPNRRIRAMGYYDSARFFGVYIWEYINVIWPLITELESKEEQEQ